VIPRPAAPTPTPTPEPIVIRFAVWSDPTLDPSLSAIRDRFARGDPRIVVETVTTPFATHFARLAKGFVAGNAADVFVDSGLFFDDQVKAGVLLDLTDRIDAARLDLALYWTEPSSQPVAGRRLALPLWAATDVLYYNRDHFASAKLPEPSASWTWTSLLDAASKLTVGKPGETTRWGVYFVNDVQGGWGSFVASNGGSWLDPVARKTTLGEAGSAEALRFVADAILVHHVAPRPTEQQALTRVGQVDPFLAGRVSLFPSGTWEMPPLLAGAKFGWDVASLPKSPGAGQSTSVGSVQPGAIARVSPHPDEAWQFLTFLTGPDAQRLLARGKARIPALKSVAADPAGYAAPPPTNASIVPKVMDGFRDLAFVPNWQAWRAAVLADLDPAFDGQVALADALAKATSDGDAALAK
jgi:multiple sugar transport system substrate-binding protein